MGQYHAIYNKTKKERIRIGGAKLWEQAHSATAAALLLLLSNSNGRGGGDFNTYPKNYDKLTKQELNDQAVIDVVSGRWSGDQIVVQGDYADEKDKAFITSEERESYKDITHLVADALLIADNGEESDVARIIEREINSQFLGIKGTKVRKKKRKCRNGQMTEIYSR